jgi:hypothetical protein
LIKVRLFMHLSRRKTGAVQADGVPGGDSQTRRMRQARDRTRRAAAAIPGGVATRCRIIFG